MSTNNTTSNSDPNTMKPPNDKITTILACLNPKHQNPLLLANELQGDSTETQLLKELLPTIPPHFLLNQPTNIPKHCALPAAIWQAIALTPTHLFDDHHELLAAAKLHSPSWWQQALDEFTKPGNELYNQQLTELLRAL